MIKIEKGENVPADSDVIAETKSEFEVDTKDFASEDIIKKRVSKLKRFEKKSKETKTDEEQNTD